MQRRKRMGTRGGGTAMVIAATMVATLCTAVQPAAASHYTNTTELSATTNPGVAAAWSKLAFPSSATEVLLGRDDLFADSLASGAMQGTRPLLLTNSQTLSADADAELNRLKPTTVNIMGGTSAVSAALENGLKSRGYQIRRFSGPTRIETAIDVARRALPTATTAILAAAFAPVNADQTRAFADSIAAGGWAADRNMPVLLTETERLSTATKNYLRGDGALIRQVFVVGGTSAVSDAAVAEMQQLGITVRRISGPTRFDTAIRIAQERGHADASKAVEVILAEGQAADSWVAGFSAAAYSASKDAPIVLSNGAALPQPTTTWLSPTAKAASTKLVCAPRVQSQACDGASEAMGHTAITGTMPRLLSVTLGTAAGGLRPVSFKFSEPLAAQVTAGNFALYRYDAQRVPATSAALDPAQPDTVIAQFADTDFGEFTVAAVAHNAVRSASNALQNPEASAGLQNYSRSEAQTRGPRLVEVEDVDVSSSTWKVLFTFDRALSSCGAKTSFLLVEADRTGTPSVVETTPGNGAGAAALDGTHSCEVEFDGMPANGDFDDFIARGVALPGAATSTALIAGAATAAKVASAASHGPDLSSIDVSGDVASFGFDRDVDLAVQGGTTTVAQNFHVVDSRGRVFDGTSAALDATSGGNEVDVTFPTGALRNVIVTGWVNGGAVKSVPNGIDDPTGTLNGADADYEKGGHTFTGNTQVPAVTAITRAVSGSTATLRYTFSGPVEESGSTGRFTVYDANGARTELSPDNCSVDASTPAEDIVCTGNQTASATIFNAIRNAVYAGASRDAYRPAGQSEDPIEDSLPSPEAGRLLG